MNASSVAMVGISTVVTPIVVSAVVTMFCWISIGRCPGWRPMVMGAFNVVPTLSAIGVLCLDQTGNQQGNSQNRNQLISLHKSPLSRNRKDVFSFQEDIFDEKFHTLCQCQKNPLNLNL